MLESSLIGVIRLCLHKNFNTKIVLLFFYDFYSVHVSITT